MRRGRDVRIDHAKDIVRVGVASKVVAIQVSNQHHLGNHMGQNATRGQLVQLHAGYLATRGAAHTRVLYKRALDTRDDVAAGAVGHQIEPARKQNIVQQIGRGCFAVSARYKYNAARLGGAGEKIGADGLGNGTGKLAAVSRGKLSAAAVALPQRARGRSEAFCWWKYSLL